MSDDIQIELENENEDDKLKKLKSQLKKCQKEKNEYLDGWQRAKADFINARKEEEEKRSKFSKFSNQLLITEILIVLDSFDIALKNEYDKGFDLIKSQLLSILEKNGLEIIKTGGEKFNPIFHESVEEVKSDLKEGEIVEEIQKGYVLNGKILRAAKVKISK